MSRAAQIVLMLGIEAVAISCLIGGVIVGDLRLSLCGVGLTVTALLVSPTSNK